MCVDRKQIRFQNTGNQDTQSNFNWVSGRLSSSNEEHKLQELRNNVLMKMSGAKDELSTFSRHYFHIQN
jgi:hypothetical protein